MFINVVIERLKGHKFFSDFFTHNSLGQFKRYLITGFTTFGLEYFSFVLLYKIILNRYHEELGYLFAKNLVYSLLKIDLKADTFRYLLANTIVYIVVFWFNFFLNRTWSFKSTEKLGRQLRLYGILFIFNLIAINSLLYLLSGIVGITPLISKVLVMGAVVSWNFIIYKKVIYR